jgi:hypothetical protein
VLSRVLSPIAATGLALAVITGFLLFSVRAQEYAGNPFFLPKVVLIAIGAGSAVAAHNAGVFRGDTNTRHSLRGGLSIITWLGALACGRLLAFCGS